jgi:hypothetical protein
MPKLTIYYTDGSQTESNLDRPSCDKILNIISDKGFDRPLDWNNGEARLIVNGKHIMRIRMEDK